MLPRAASDLMTVQSHIASKSIERSLAENARQGSG